MLINQNGGVGSVTGGEIDSHVSSSRFQRLPVFAGPLQQVVVTYLGFPGTLVTSVCFLCVCFREHAQLKAGGQACTRGID